MQSSIKARTESLYKANKELESNRINLEKIVEIRTRELKGSLDELKRTQKKLIETEKMASLVSLVSGVAHELNTPLGIGVTAASHLTDETKIFKKLYDSALISKSVLDNYTELAIESSSLILSNLNRASETVRRFKEIVITQTETKFSTFKIGSHIRDTIESLKYLNVEMKHKVKLNVKEDFCISSDSIAISNIIRILLTNSIQHGFKKIDSGTINISVSLIKKNVVISYKDDGIGIDDKHIKNIFDPFFTTSRHKRSIGLGLSILYSLVSFSLHGTVTCESGAVSGTKFTVIFPYVL